MLKDIYKLEFKIELLTGLHIGGSSDTFDIGGADSTVIKNPLTNEPYIPGSSIKGKLRSLLTQKYPCVSDDNKQIDISDLRVKSIFEPTKLETSTINVSRAIFRDSYLTEDSRKGLQDILGLGSFTEIKAENKINIIKGTAETPRFIERVPAGATFNGEIILQVYEGDDSEFLKNKIIEALKMLEFNYLGGSGTRGYGRVKIHLLKEFEKVEF